MPVILSSTSCCTGVKGGCSSGCVTVGQSSRRTFFEDDTVHTCPRPMKPFFLVVLAFSFWRSPFLRRALSAGTLEWEDGKIIEPCWMGPWSGRSVRSDLCEHLGQRFSVVRHKKVGKPSRSDLRHRESDATRTLTARFTTARMRVVRGDALVVHPRKKLEKKSIEKWGIQNALLLCS